MAVMNDLLLAATRVAIRAATDTPSPSADPSSTVTTPQAASPTGDPSSQNTSKDKGSSPLLFFVALGFGVVFTNLWIIVGVKYCFRYNARNRARLGEDGEPVPLETMPRPHRRRREKKLMTMDEVNDKFPMMKYKTWVIERAREGLPTAGGVDISASRANSLHNVEAISAIVVTKERHSMDEASAAAVKTDESTATEPNSKNPDEKPNNFDHDKDIKKADAADTAGQTSTAAAKADDIQRVESHDDDDEDDDEHINAALPPER
ncbi:hypothetical protein NQ176_g7875 [Zarea fungicola]|uniref:Uncharacterized protein n=1 Tax=Zarea fungicola TaxID=93591 RepID=A0ACC1MVN8_9HYPO|nr:hypothetical protein NQ176_g7875 [Lecanicillium fungicola]